MWHPKTHVCWAGELSALDPEGSWSNLRDKPTYGDREVLLWAVLCPPVARSRSVPFGRKRSGLFESDFRLRTGSATTSRCSTLQSTVSCAAAISSAFGSMTSRQAAMSKSERRSFSIKPAVRFSSRSWSRAGSAAGGVEGATEDRGPYVFPSRDHDQPHLAARQYAGIVHGWIEGAGMESSAYGTHSTGISQGGLAATRTFENRKRSPLSRYRGRRRSKSF